MSSRKSLRQPSIASRDGDDEGLAIGEAGAPSYAVLNPDTPGEHVFRREAQAAVFLKSGDVMSSRAGGGSGYGPPSARKRTRVARDVEAEIVTVETVSQIYGFRSKGPEVRKKPSDGGHHRRLPASVPLRSVRRGT